MAVYTMIDEEALHHLLRGYDIGQAVTCQGITEGVENSNYKLTTTTGDFILTIYEKRVSPKDLPFFMGLMTHLSQTGYPCPTPIADKKQCVLQTHANKPLAIVSFLQGQSHPTPTPSHCYQAGAVLARLHLAAADFTGGKNNLRVNALGQSAWQGLFETCHATAKTLTDNFKALDLKQTLATIDADWPQSLPKGIIHADLFPDNVLFADSDNNRDNIKISGVIDFYFACYDFLAYDLAIMINAWCFDTPDALNREKSAALIDGYTSQRQLTTGEWEALPLLVRGAAMRFFLTRLYDWEHTPKDAQVKRLDPLDYWQRLLVHSEITHASQFRPTNAMPDKKPNRHA
ncbi:MAG: homoserine kinase [Proteobacteria bacterium]|nr:homoserine kinase [Pseudomonadota bacterium]